MEAKDTAMSPNQLGGIIFSDVGMGFGQQRNDSDIEGRDGCYHQIIQLQAEISFKAGYEKGYILGTLDTFEVDVPAAMKKGMQKVVDYIIKYRTESIKEYICLAFIKKDWQAFLEENGLGG